MSKEESSGDPEQDARMERYEAEKKVKNKELENVISLL